MRLKDVDEFLEGYAPVWRTKALLRSDHLSAVKTLYPDIDDKEVAYLYCNNIEGRPVCLHCKNPVNWFGNRYATSCSRRCSNLHRDADLKNAFIERNKTQSRARVEKRIKTCIGLYGGNVMKGKKYEKKSDEEIATIVDKIKQTHLTRYGFENISQSPEVKAKAKQTFVKNRESRYIKNEEKLMLKIQSRTHASETLLEMISPEGEQANRRYRILCDCGYEANYASETFKFRMRQVGRVCTKCCGITTSTSFAEKEIAKLFPDSMHNDRNIIYPRELDIVIPENKLAIEYCGLYWHSENAGKPKKYHQYKLAQCREKGYRLITIFEDEWKNKPEIVTSMLANIIGDNQEKISARKCEIRKLDSRVGNEFIVANHIQGRGRANVYYGLYHEDRLVSVMSFSNSEISRRSQGWDINRFCSLIGVTVRGGAGKLFKYFVREHNPEQVISYADLRWGTGAVYGNIGFQHIADTVPNYWYFRDNEMRRYHRYGLRKNSSDDASKTEWQNRQEQGWNRIWDCGHAKWLWSNPEVATHHK